MRTAVAVLIASMMLLAGSAIAQDGYYATKADAKAGRLTPGRPAGDPGPASPDVGGENCGTATGIGSLPFNDSDNTTGHVDDNNAVPVNCGTGFAQSLGPDLIYVFSTGPGNNIAFNVNPTNTIFDPSLYILGTCGNNTTCVVGVDGCLAQGQPQDPTSCPDGDGDEDIPALLDRFAPGTHAIYVDSFYPGAPFPCGGQNFQPCGSGPYTLSVTGVLPAELIDIRIE
jgi:hypothetical protein